MNKTPQRTGFSRSRWLAPLAGLMVLAGLLAGCARGAAPAPATPATPATPAAPAPAPANPAPAPANPAPAPASAGFPVTVTGDDGVAVTLAQRPERIISIAPSNTELLFAIGTGDQVVAVDTFSDYPEAATLLPSVGGVTDPDFELMASLQPDLALSVGGTDAIIAKLRELGVPVLMLQPETMDDLYDTIARAGQATGHAEAAAEVVADMRQRVAAVTDRTASLSDDERPAVFYLMWPEPLMTAGPGSFIDDLITLAGGRNIGGDAPIAFAEFSHEQVLSRDPEVILVPGPYQAEEADRIRAGEYPGWTGLRAVTGDRVYVVTEDHVTRPGPRLALGLEELARLLHPELFR